MERLGFGLGVRSNRDMISPDTFLFERGFVVALSRYTIRRPVILPRLGFSDQFVTNSSRHHLCCWTDHTVGFFDSR